MTKIMVFRKSFVEMRKSEPTAKLYHRSRMPSLFSRLWLAHRPITQITEVHSRVVPGACCGRSSKPEQQCHIWVRQEGLP